MPLTTAHKDGDKTKGRREGGEGGKEGGKRKEREEGKQCITCTFYNTYIINYILQNGM